MYVANTKIQYCTASTEVCVNSKYRVTQKVLWPQWPSRDWPSRDWPSRDAAVGVVDRCGCLVAKWRVTSDDVREICLIYSVWHGAPGAATAASLGPPSLAGYHRIVKHVTRASLFSAICLKRGSDRRAESTLQRSISYRQCRQRWWGCVCTYVGLSVCQNVARNLLRNFPH